MSTQPEPRIVLRDLVLELAALQSDLQEAEQLADEARRRKLLGREEQIIEELRALGPDPLDPST